MDCCNRQRSYKRQHNTPIKRLNRNSRTCWFIGIKSWIGGCLFIWSEFDRNQSIYLIQ